MRGSLVAGSRRRRQEAIPMNEHSDDAKDVALLVIVILLVFALAMAEALGPRLTSFNEPAGPRTEPDVTAGRME
jgi:hypothetical protein